MNVVNYVGMGGVNCTTQVLWYVSEQGHTKAGGTNLPE